MLGLRQAKLQEQVIEIAPLAYMRGRTLNGAYIILDESQNTTREQMKMFLTRIGFGSTAVITGDTSQIDLPKGVRSGLVHAREVLSSVEEISFTNFESRDVVRHPVVQSIVGKSARKATTSQGVEITMTNYVDIQSPVPLKTLQTKTVSGAG